MNWIIRGVLEKLFLETSSGSYSLKDIADKNA
jgi:hypothetical protein